MSEKISLDSSDSINQFQTEKIEHFTKGLYNLFLNQNQISAKNDPTKRTPSKTRLRRPGFPIRKNSHLFTTMNGNNVSANKCLPTDRFETINLCFRQQTNSPAGNITSRTE